MEIGKAVIGLALASVCLAAAAQGKSAQDQIDECQVVPMYENRVACLQDVLQEHDKRLNDAYKKAMGRVPPDMKTALRDKQRAWIKRRDAACKASVDEANLAACNAKMTADRASELERM